MNLARAISVPGKINTFPQGDAAVVAVPVSFLNQLLEEIEILKAQVVSLGGTCAIFREEIGGQNAKIAVLETVLTGQKKIVVLGSGEKIAQLNPNTVDLGSGQRQDRDYREEDS